MNNRLLISTFAHEQDIIAATRTAREGGYRIVDVYTPYAVHGLDAAMGLKPSNLPWICFVLGITGAIAKLWYQIWTSATSWPVNVGGKPLKSLPAFVPVTFEIMVLFAGVGTVLAFFIVSRLRPGKKPTVNYKGVTDDKFVLVLEQTDARFDIGTLQKLFAPFHCVSMEEQIGRSNGAIPREGRRA